ncbi:nuclear transport factor 2 family protein [Micromonospora sp. NPDC049559]|uniref:nuclear transport factor 2 family protein n=1 Tax=Micromonospora sp. NPDC049559 TaxID=3155923 RepID=UPI0034402E8C
MTDFAAVVDRYLAAWNEPDAEARGRAVRELWTEDGTYTDPLAEVAGHDGIAAVIAGAREMFPGLVFRARGAVDGHHDLVRFGWELVAPSGGESIVEGFDVATLTAEGRIRAVHGFLDKVPAGA